MKTRYLILLLLLPGCAVSPPANPWDSLTTETSPATAALDCGSFPMPSETTDSLSVYTETGTNALEAYRLCSEANQGNVDEHAAQILQLKIARKGLVEAGQAQRSIADMRAEMLQDERRHHFWSNVSQWVVILGLGAAL